MACGFFDFRINPFIKILFWILIIVGVSLYIWDIWVLTTLSNVYPTTTTLYGAGLTAHFSFIIIFLWMPGSNLLIHFKIKIIWINILFVVGCLIGIILSIVTIILLESYTQINFTREEYINETATAIINDKETTPKWIRSLEKDCCSWYGTYDFGTIYEVYDTPKFIASLKKECLTTEGVKQNPSTGENEPIYKPMNGCGKSIKVKVKESCNGLLITSVIAIILGLLTIIIYLYYYFKLIKTKEGVNEAEPTTSSVPESETNKLDGESNTQSQDTTGKNSSGRRNVSKEKIITQTVSLPPEIE